MVEEALSSNVLNYLVWRYLQEQGYGSAALQLMQSWCSSPDDLPFASNVSSRTLVQLVQFGLTFDSLSAAATGQTRTFRFGKDHGPANPLPSAVRRGMEDRLSRTELPYYPDQHRLLDRPVTPLPRTDDDDEDADVDPDRDGMDVDPDIESDGEVGVLQAATPPPSTSDPGVNAAVQCDPPRKLDNHTVLLDLGPDSSAVAHVRWHDSDSQVVSVVAGGRMSHFFVSHPGDLFAQLFTSRSFDGPGFEISRVCWTGEDECVVFGVDRAGPAVTERVWVASGGGSRVAPLTSYVGLATAAEWNGPARLLLSLSATLTTTTIRIWSDPGAGGKQRVVGMPSVGFDGAWTDDRGFVVCSHGRIDRFELAEEPDGAISMVATVSGPVKWESIQYDVPSGLVGLVSFDDNAVGLVDSQLRRAATVRHFDDGRITDFAFQPVSPNSNGRAAKSRMMAVCFDSGIVELVTVDPNDLGEDKKEKEDDGMGDGEDGELRPHTSMQVETVCRMCMPGVGAYALAFSPDGRRLAAAGLNSVLVWNVPTVGTAAAVSETTSNEIVPRAEWKWPVDADGRWRRQFQSRPGSRSRPDLGTAITPTESPTSPQRTPVVGPSPDTDTAALSEIRLPGPDVEAVRRHDLSWDRHGRKLAYAVDGQVAVIEVG